MKYCVCYWNCIREINIHLSTVDLPVEDVDGDMWEDDGDVGDDVGEDQEGPAVQATGGVLGHQVHCAGEQVALKIRSLKWGLVEVRVQFRESVQFRLYKLE